MKINLPELELLLFIVKNPRGHLPKTLFGGKLKWKAVSTYLGRNKLIPFLAHHFNCPKCSKLFPPKFSSLVRQQYLKASFLENIQKKEKKKLGQLLSKNDIQAITLKDYLVYGIKYPRGIFSQKVDIDFFLPHDSPFFRKKIGQIMQSLGYQRIVFPPPKDRFALLEQDYVKNGQLYINFHLRDALPETEGKISPINPPAVKRFTKLFTSSIKKTKIGLFVPSLEMGFLFTCFHFFFRDYFTGLRTLWEIHLLLVQKGRRLDWKKIINIAKTLELENYLLFVLGISRLVFKTPLPTIIEQETRPAVKLALNLYHPALTLLVPRWRKKDNQMELFHYRFFLKLLLWPKPFWQKLGPRVLYLFFRYFLPVLIFFKLKKLK